MDTPAVPPSLGLASLVHDPFSGPCTRSLPALGCKVSAGAGCGSRSRRELCGARRATLRRLSFPAQAEAEFVTEEPRTSNGTLPAHGRAQNTRPLFNAGGASRRQTLRDLLPEEINGRAAILRCTLSSVAEQLLLDPGSSEDRKPINSISPIKLTNPEPLCLESLEFLVASGCTTVVVAADWKHGSSVPQQHMADALASMLTGIKGGVTCIPLALDTCRHDSTLPGPTTLLSEGCALGGSAQLSHQLSERRQGCRVFLLPNLAGFRQLDAANSASLADSLTWVPELLGGEGDAYPSVPGGASPGQWRSADLHRETEGSTGRRRGRRVGVLVLDSPSQSHRALASLVGISARLARVVAGREMEAHLLRLVETLHPDESGVKEGGTASLGEPSGTQGGAVVMLGFHSLEKALPVLSGLLASPAVGQVVLGGGAAEFLKRSQGWHLDTGDLPSACPGGVGMGHLAGRRHRAGVREDEWGVRMDRGQTGDDAMQEQHGGRRRRCRRWGGAPSEEEAVRRGRGESEASSASCFIAFLNPLERGKLFLLRQEACVDEEHAVEQPWDNRAYHGGLPNRPPPPGADLGLPLQGGQKWSLRRFLEGAGTVLWMGPVFSAPGCAAEVALLHWLQRRAREGNCRLVLIGQHLERLAQAASATTAGSATSAAPTRHHLDGGVRVIPSSPAVQRILEGKSESIPALSMLDFVPPPPPTWDAVYLDPSLPLCVDVGCGQGLFCLRLGHLGAGVINMLGVEVNAHLVQSAFRRRDWGGWDLGEVHVTKLSSPVLREIIPCHESAWTGRCGGSGGRGVGNVHFVQANATSSLLPLLMSYPGPIGLFTIMCPDPDFNCGPHARWSMLKPPLVSAMERLLSRGGHMYVASDVEDVARSMVRGVKEWSEGGLKLVTESEMDQCHVWWSGRVVGVHSEWEERALRSGKRMYRALFVKE